MSTASFALTLAIELIPELLPRPRKSMDLGSLQCSPDRRCRVDASLHQVYSETAVAEATARHPRSHAPMNLPNSLTLLRIFFVPVLIVILLTRSPNVDFWGFSMHFEVWGVLILLLAAATDWADGYLARRRLQVTTLGILLAGGHAPCAPVDGGDHHRQRIHGSRSSEYRLGRGIHDRSIHAWKDEDGFAGVCGCGTHRCGAAPVAETAGANPALARCD